jgi:hypothetical protein
MLYSITQLGMITKPASILGVCYHNGLVVYCESGTYIHAASFINNVLTPLPGLIGGTTPIVGLVNCIGYSGGGVFFALTEIGNIKAFGYDQGTNSFVELTAWIPGMQTYGLRCAMTETGAMIVQSGSPSNIGIYNFSGSFSRILNLPVNNCIAMCYNASYMYTIETILGFNRVTKRYWDGTGMTLISQGSDAHPSLAYEITFDGTYIIVCFSSGYGLQAYIDNGDGTITPVGNRLNIVNTTDKDSLTMMNNFIVLKTFNASLSVVYFYKFNGTDFILYGSYSQGTTGSATLSNLSVESSFAFYGDGTTNLRAITFKPEATFSCNKTTGTAPLTVNFSAEDVI